MTVPEGDDAGLKGREAARRVECVVCGVELSWQGRGRKPKYCAACRSKARYERSKRDGTQKFADLPQAEVLKLVGVGKSLPPPVPTDDQRDGPVLAAAKRLFDTVDTQHPAAELLLEAIVSLAIDVDSADSGPTQRSNSAREMRGLITDLVSFRPVVQEAKDEDIFGIRDLSA